MKEMYRSEEVKADLRWEMGATGGADVDASVEGRGSPNEEDVYLTGMCFVAIKCLYAHAFYADGLLRDSILSHLRRFRLLFPRRCFNFSLNYHHRH